VREAKKSELLEAFLILRHQGILELVIRAILPSNDLPRERVLAIFFSESTEELDIFIDRVSS
jgi:hypothetical protein